MYRSGNDFRSLHTHFTLTFVAVKKRYFDSEVVNVIYLPVGVLLTDKFSLKYKIQFLSNSRFRVMDYIF